MEQQIEIFQFKNYEDGIESMNIVIHVYFNLLYSLIVDLYISLIDNFDALHK